MNLIWKKAAFGISLASVVLLVLAGVFLFLGHVGMKGVCGNTVYGVYPSPSFALKAVLFERSCGATTGFTTQISILPYRNQLPDDEEGNIFFVKGDPRQLAISMSWDNDHSLWVHRKLYGNEIAHNEFAYGDQIINVRYGRNGS